MACSPQRFFFGTKPNPKRLAFVGFKADLKARHTMHTLERWYKCNKLLDAVYGLVLNLFWQICFFFSAGSYFHEGWYQNSLGFVTGAWPIKGWTVVPQWTTETLDLQRHGHLHLYPMKHTWSWTAIVSHLGKKCQGFISEQFVTTGCIIRIWEQLGIYAALAPSPESFFYFSTGQGAPPFHFF